MVDALEAAPPFAGGWRSDVLSMFVCPPRGIVHLAGARDSRDAAALPAAGRCVSHAVGAVLSIGPDAYLCVGGADADSDALQAWFRVVVDVSSAWIHLAVVGPKAAELLRKGCAIDLHERMSPTGACSATGYARMRVVLWRTSAEARYDMLVGRSYALSLWAWLTEAAAQYGGQQTKEDSP